MDYGPGPVVWLASYPKSGNTWLRAMLTALLRDEVGTPDLASLVSGSKQAERDFLDNWCGVESAILRDDELRPYLRTMRLIYGGLATAPALTKTHEKFGYTGAGLPLFPAEVSRAAILIVRHPFDVAVSFAAHNLTDIDGAISRMEDPGYVLNDRTRWNSAFLPVLMGSWSGHTQSWLDQTEVPLLVLRYEDMLADPAAALARVAGAAGIDATPSQIAAAAESCAFQRLQDAESVSGFEEKPAGMARFFREGRSGQGREVLADAQATRIVERHGATMERLGYGIDGDRLAVSLHEVDNGISIKQNVSRNFKWRGRVS